MDARESLDAVADPESIARQLSERLAVAHRQARRAVVLALSALLVGPLSGAQLAGALAARGPQGAAGPAGPAGPAGTPGLNVLKVSKVQKIHKAKSRSR